MILMNIKIERLILAAALIVGLSCAWTGLLDEKAATVVDAGLNRGLATFASARTVNAALSVAQSLDVSAKPFGFGANISIGQALHPINEMVGQFSELMLAACVSLGAMKLLIVIAGYKGLSLLLTAVGLWWLWIRWHRKPMPIIIPKALLVLLLIRFAIPLVSVGSEVLFQEFLKAEYTTSQTALAEAPVDDMTEATGTSSGQETGTGRMLANIKERWASAKNVPAHFERLKQFAATVAEHMIRLIVVFVLQTLVLPLFLFWGLYRIGLSILESKPRLS